MPSRRCFDGLFLIPSSSSSRFRSRRCGWRCALRTAARMARRQAGGHQLISPLRPPVHGCVVCQLIPVLAESRRNLHGVLPAARLSDGLRNCALRVRTSRSVLLMLIVLRLDVVPASGLCMDRPAQAQRRDQQRAHVARYHSRAITMLQTDFAVISVSSIRTCPS